MLCVRVSKLWSHHVCLSLPYSSFWSISYLTSFSFLTLVHILYLCYFRYTQTKSTQNFVNILIVKHIVLISIQLKVIECACIVHKKYTKILQLLNITKKDSIELKKIRHAQPTERMRNNTHIPDLVLRKKIVCLNSILIAS